MLTSDRAESDLDGLVAKLGGLPLALAQAGSYLRETGTSVTSYIELYLHHWVELVSCDNGTIPCVLDYRLRDIRFAWYSSFLAIKAKDENAGKLLLLWSCLDCKDLWYGLLRDAASDSDGAPTYPRWLRELASNEARFLRSMRLILGCSLAQKNEFGGYKLHPVVHRWIEHLRTPSELIKFGELAVRITSSAVPASTCPGFWGLQKRILPHANRCATWLEDELNVRCLHDNSMVGPLVALGTLYSDQHELDRAEWMLSRAVDAQDGPDVSLAAAILRMLASVYARQHRFADAASTYQFLLEGLRHDARHRSEHEHCSSMWSGEGFMAMAVDALQDCAKLYLDCQGHLEAESLFNYVLKYREDEEPATLNAKNDRGCVYASQGRYEDAEDQFRLVLNFQDKLLGPNHPLTLHTIHNIGLLHAIQGRFEDGEVLCRHAKQLYDDTLGHNHPVALLMASNIEAMVSKQNIRHIGALSGSAISIGDEFRSRISHDIQRHLCFCSSRPITPYLCSKLEEWRYPENQRGTTRQSEPVMSEGENEQDVTFPALFESAVALRKLLVESAAVTSQGPHSPESSSPALVGADDALPVKIEEE